MALTKAKLIADNAVKAVHIDETDTGITLAQLNVTGNITATNVAGTLSTAAQPNITSVGTLSSLTTSGILQVTGIADDAFAAKFFSTSGAFRILPFQIGQGVRIQATNASETAFETLSFSGSDHQFVCGITETMRITSSGNVGIGTSSPDSYYSKDLVVSASTEGGITIVSDPTEAAYIMFADGTSGADRYRGYINYYHLNNSLVFASDGTERMRIDASGNVGIGTASPEAKLDVKSGALIVDTVANNYGGLKIDDDSIGDYNVNFRAGRGGPNSGFRWFLNARPLTSGAFATGNEKMALTNTGLGIGTSSPTLTAGATGIDIYNSSDAQVRLHSFNTGTSASDGVLFSLAANNDAYMWNYENANFIFGTNSTERMRITSGGDVLIGTTADFGGKLNIGGDNISIVTRGGTSTNSGTWNMQRADTGAVAWRISSNQDNFFVADADFSHYAFLSQNPTAWVFGSDKRLKQDIKDIDYGLDTILNIKPRRFTFKSSQKNTVGFIAQELKGVVPEAVTGEEKEILDTDTNEEISKKILGVSSDTLIPILVKSIQELKDIVDQQQIEIDNLKAQLNG